MLRVLSVCLSVVLVGMFYTSYGRIAAFLAGLLFSFVNDHLDEPVEMLYLWVEDSGFICSNICRPNACVSQLRSWFIFYSNPFLIIANTFSLYL